MGASAGTILRRGSGGGLGRDVPGEPWLAPTESLSPPRSIVRAVLRPTAIVFSGVIGLIFAASWVRESVIRRNFAIMGLEKPRFFRLRLGFALAGNLFDLLMPGRLPAPRIHSRSVRHAAALGGDACRVAASRGPTGSLLLTAHFGNWEAQAAAWRALGVPLLGAARPIRSARVAALVARIRARHDIRVVHAGVPRAALRHLGAGGCFGLLWDQHAPDSIRPGRFFGAETSLNPLPFFLLRKHPCPVYFGVLSPGGALRLVLLLDPVRGFRDGWEDRLARRYHRVLETLVRARPAQWHGILHARFKTLGKYPGHRSSPPTPGKSRR